MSLGTRLDELNLNELVIDKELTKQSLEHVFHELEKHRIPVERVVGGRVLIDFCRREGYAGNSLDLTRYVGRMWGADFYIDYTMKDDIVQALGQSFVVNLRVVNVAPPSADSYSSKRWLCD